MLNYFRRTAQVAVLTCVLIFGTLLMLGSFETTGWSDSHHGFEYTREIHYEIFYVWYKGRSKLEKHYESGGHSDDTIH